MGKEVIYIQPEQSSYLIHPEIRVGDICSVYCADKAIEEKVNHISIYEFKKDEDGRAFMSALYLVQEILRQVPQGEIKNLGEQDIVIYYKCPRKKIDFWVQRGKIIFICVTCFLGMGMSIMGYNNDVDINKVFSQLYETFTGTKPAGPTFIELFYSLGLTVGIFLFFNHIPGRKVTNEPTPIQVQMRLYEQEVNQAFLMGASRKGEELDVCGKHKNNRRKYDNGS